jgi:hypothetical protein
MRPRMYTYASDRGFDVNIYFTQKMSWCLLGSLLLWSSCLLEGASFAWVPHGCFPRGCLLLCLEVGSFGLLFRRLWGIRFSLWGSFYTLCCLSSIVVCCWVHLFVADPSSVSTLPVFVLFCLRLLRQPFFFLLPEVCSGFSLYNVGCNAVSPLLMNVRAPIFF